MAKKEITTHEAKTHLSRYLQLAQKGFEVIIKRGTVPVAKLVSFEEKNSAAKRKRPAVGDILSEGVSYSGDCFAPLASEDLKDWGI